MAMRDEPEKLRRWREKVLKGEEKSMQEVMPRKKKDEGGKASKEGSEVPLVTVF